MAKLALNDVVSLQAEASALQTLNANAAATEAALENTLSLDGTAPNQMEASLDLNDNRIINLGAPVSGTDAARLVDISNALSVEAILIPSMTGNEDKLLTNDGTDLLWAEPADIPDLGDMQAANNLSEIVSVATARTNLGLGSAALEDVGVSGAVLGLLDDDLTFSGANTHAALVTMSAGGAFGGTVEYRISGTPTALSSDSIGYRGAPVNTRDAVYTFVLGDSGTTVLHTSATGHAWTIPPNASVAYPNGTVIVLANIGTGAVTVTRGAGVALRIGGTSTDKDMTLAQHGIASILKLDTNTWYISGTGVS